MDADTFESAFIGEDKRLAKQNRSRGPAFTTNPRTLDRSTRRWACRATWNATISARCSSTRSGRPWTTPFPSERIRVTESTQQTCVSAEFEPLRDKVSGAPQQYAHRTPSMHRRLQECSPLPALRQRRTKTPGRSAEGHAARSTHTHLSRKAGMHLLNPAKPVKP